MNGRVWTEDENRKLFRLYPDLPTSIVAKELGRTMSSTYGQAHKIGVFKSQDFLAAFCRLQKGCQVGRSTQYVKGQVPANKGVRRPGWSPGRMRETQFRRGERSGVAVKLYKPIGTERMSKDGYLERKVNDDLPLQRRWRAVHLIIWEAEYGPVPRGHAVVFKNGNRGDIRLDNLELIQRGDLMRRNTIHKLPVELKQTIRLAGRVKRAIRRRVKDASEKQT